MQYLAWLALAAQEVAHQVEVSGVQLLQHPQVILHQRILVLRPRDAPTTQSTKTCIITIVAIGKEWSSYCYMPIKLSDTVTGQATTFTCSTRKRVM